MSQDARYRYRREHCVDSRRRHRYPRSRHRRRHEIWKEGDNNYRQEFTKFPKFKDNRSEANQNFENMKNESKESEPNSSGIGGGYNELETSKERSKAPIRRKRRDEKVQIGKVTNAGTQDSKNWEKSEGQHDIQLNEFPNTRKIFRSPSSDLDVHQLKAQVEFFLKKNKENPKHKATPSQPTLKDNTVKNASSSSSSSSDSSSEEENPIKPKQVKKENVSEDEVVCLGAVEQVENLIEKSSDNGITESCILCEKEGHTSFYCFMVCKNCGGKYHSLKNCPKPANISNVLLRFMEFNLSQCRQYNPEEKFDFNSHLHAASEGIQDALKRYFESNTSVRPSPGHSKSSRKRRSSSADSQGSSSGNTSKKRKHRKSNADLNNSFNPFSLNCGFTPSFPFGTPGMPFGAQGVNMNSMLAFAQMMGQFPFNSTNNRI